MMKRTLWLLILAICTAVFTGCGEEQEESKIVFASDPVESYDNESVFLPEGTVSEESASPPEESRNEIEGFVVKDKTYAYGENKVVLLNIENTTTKDYTLTVDGTYYDQKGKAIKTETQTFEDFVAGYQGYFLFHPEMSFDRFAYTLSFQHFEGEAQLSNVKPLVFDLEGAGYQVWKAMPGTDGFDDWHYSICTGYRYLNQNKQAMYIKSAVLVFDCNDKLILAQVYGYDETYAESVGGMDFTLYSSYSELTKDKSTWPEQLQEEIQIIVIPIDAIPSDEYEIGNPPM